MAVKPVSIEVNNREQELVVEWSDSHRSKFPLFGLRKNCPCVVCRGGHGNMDRFDRELFFVDSDAVVEIVDIRQIGNHAIRIHWSDGHSNGMYQWETLRKLCPCEECYPRDHD